MRIVDRAACILPADRKYVMVSACGTMYRLTTCGCPALDGEDGIVARFERGADVDVLAEDYGATRRAIEAGIRTMHRCRRGLTT